MTNPATQPLQPRQEAFCRHLAEGRSLAESARAAGCAPASARQRGSELWALPEVQERVAELTAQRAAARLAALEKACERLETVVSGALEQEQYAVALKALALQVRLLGLDPSRRQQEVADPVPALPMPALPPLPAPPPKRLEAPKAARAAAPSTVRAPGHPSTPLLGALPLAEIRAQIDAALAGSRRKVAAPASCRAAARAPARSMTNHDKP